MTRRRRGGWGSCLLAIGAVSVAAGLTSGCGDEAPEEPAYTAESFVAAVNADAPILALGEPFATNQDGLEILAVSLLQSPRDHADAPAGHDHGSGALLILPDSAAAAEELQRCESAPSLTCFNAHNGVLRFTGLPPADARRLAGVFARLEG